MAWIIVLFVAVMVGMAWALMDTSSGSSMPTITDDDYPYEDEGGRYREQTLLVGHVPINRKIYEGEEPIL